ncbi:MAG: type II 3-dehydroquinate dehydratase [Chitinivibrionia bacterium]|nr:type II 3-dehydroquinate dehydratase [Chitinivibrionia bacterium]
MKIGILNGPNLNLLGKREPDIYGNLTLDDLKNQLLSAAKNKNITLEFAQSNVEGELINIIQEWAKENCDGVIFNPGAYTHTSIALRDAISSLNMPFVEVHISNIYKREEFRQHSFTAGASVGVISGLGFFGYVAALQYLTEFNEKKSKNK